MTQMEHARRMPGGQQLINVQYGGEGKNAFALFPFLFGRETLRKKTDKLYWRSLDCDGSSSSLSRDTFKKNLSH